MKTLLKKIIYRLFIPICLVFEQFEEIIIH